MEDSNCRVPKYNFGLLETPDSSDLLSDVTLLSSDVSTMPAYIATEEAQVRYSVSPEDVPSTSHLSTTLCASAEATENSSKSKDTFVFQVPSVPVPKRSFTTNWTPKAISISRLSSCPSSGNRISVTTEPSSVKSTPLRKGTPRSRSGDTPRLHEPSVIVAVVEGRGIASGEVGMASIDLKNPVLSLSQFPDSQTYVKTLTKLNLLQPKEFVFPSTMCDSGNMANVFKVVSENFSGSSISTIQRRYFNEANGLEDVKKLAMKEHSSIESDVKAKYYCLAATAALIRYVEFVQNTFFAPESLSIVYKGSEQTTLIDSKTAAVLELLTNLEDHKSHCTLFGTLNNTKTLGGAKLLRCNILQPPNDLPTIQARLDCVDELVDSSELFYGLQSVLTRFEIDIDHLLAALVQIPKQNTDKTRENRISTCVLLKHVTELVPALLEVLSDVQSELLQAYKASLQDTRFGHIHDILDNVIHKDARYQKGHLNMRTQRCFAVKSGINGILDLSRQTYTEYIDDINELIRQLAEKHDLPLKSAYSATRGFHIQLAVKDTHIDLPEVFTKVSKTKKTWSFTTNDLMQLNDRLEQSVRDINMLADSIVSEELKKVRGSIGCLYNLSEIVSTLDMLLSFAHTRLTTECVRPEFTDTLAVKQGKHPVLASLCAHVIPNNVYASEGSNFNIITGPNMAGKSTYLKMIALLQILAQMGCHVPAEFASFRITNQIFSRVGSDDDIDTNTSSFTMEMKEISYIIQNIQDDSLVIIDELGRGTSAEEGVGLCWAIAEFMLSQKAFTFFATHFLELCRMESVYPNVENYHFEIKHVLSRRGGLRKVAYTYVLSRGFTKESHYGLQLAELFNFPSDVIDNARDIATKLQEEKQASDAATNSDQRKENANYRFATKLLQVARSSRLDDEALKEYLTRLRDDFVKEIRQCEAVVTTQTDLPRGQESNAPLSSSNTADTVSSDISSAEPLPSKLPVRSVLSDHTNSPSFQP